MTDKPSIVCTHKLRGTDQEVVMVGVRIINGTIESLVYIPEPEREIYVDCGKVEPVRRPRPDVMREVRRVMTACENGRDLVLIGLFRAMVSVLSVNAHRKLDHPGKPALYAEGC